MGSSFSTNREKLLDNMKNIIFELIVIGGGITGAGIALDAASRGMKTALIEMQDFAAGTSSRSTKIIDGGLMHLKSMNMKLITSAAKERRMLYENAPHIVKKDWMLLPIYENSGYGKLMTSAGLRMYDFMSSNKKMRKPLYLIENKP